MSNREDYIKSKVVGVEEALQKIAVWRMQDNKVVFTNGCFDILHLGHTTYLAKAASEGQKMVVGINSDASVRRQNKGDDRPINDEVSRSLVLASLGFVDMVVMFGDDTPLELIKQLKPDVLVKGGDYDENESDKASNKYIVGSDFVKKNGGSVTTISLVDGFSTTSIVNKLSNS